jgi:hypothetical protein
VSSVQPLSLDEPPRARAIVGLFAFYGLLACAYAWPILPRLASHVPHDAGDPLLNAWILWWNAHAAPLTEAWWNAPIFHPVPGALAFSEHLLGISVVATPAQWLGANPLLAYNLAFLLSFALSGLFAHLLARRLTGRLDAGLVGGLAFAFAPYRAAQLSHLQVLSSYWMPLALLALHAYFAGGRLRWLAVFAVAWLLQGLSNGYFLVFFSILVALWLGWFGTAPGSIRRLSAAAGALVLAGAPILLLLLRVREVHAVNGFERTLTEIERFSGTIESLRSASGLVALWGNPSVMSDAERQLFPGLTVVAVVAAAAMQRVRARRTSHVPAGAWRRGVLLAAAALLLVAASAALWGPYRFRVLGLGVSVTQAHKPLTLAALALAFHGVTGPRFRDAWRRRSCFAFYLGATLAMLLFSLGPEPRWMGTQVLYKPPYAWLLELPGALGLRVPARFAMLTALCLAVTASLAWAQLTRRRPRAARPLLVLVLAGVLADGWVRTMPVAPAPPFIELLRRVPDGHAVLEWPIGYVDRDVTAMYRAIVHRHRTVNGYSGHRPAFFEALRMGIGRGEPDALAALTDHAPIALLLDRSADDDQRVARMMARVPGATLAGEEGTRVLYLASRTTPVPPPPPGSALPIVRIEASVNAADVENVRDRRLRTRWSTNAPQHGAEQLTVHLGARSRVTGVSLSSGPFMTDFPRELAIDTSLDGAAWTERWRGAISGLAVAAALAEPAAMPIRIGIEPHVATVIRLRQTGRDQTALWSIAELRVEGEK